MLKTCINQTVPETSKKSMKFSLYFRRKRSVSMLFWSNRVCTVSLQDQQSHFLFFAWLPIAGPWKPLLSLWLARSRWQSLSSSHWCCSWWCGGMPGLPSEGRTPCWHVFCFEVEDYFWMPQDWLTSLSSNPQPQDSVPFTLLLRFYFFRKKEEASEHMLNISSMPSLLCWAQAHQKYAFAV